MVKKIQRQTHTLDAAGISLGRLATKAAVLLRGKSKTSFAPHIDGGDFVNIINASKIKFTGKKFVQKKYFWHTFYPGGQKTPTIAALFAKNPVKVVWKAVYGMLPKNKLRAKTIKRLKVSL